MIVDFKDKARAKEMKMKPKRQKVAKANPIEAQKEENEIITGSETL
jgi:hypothetical protein